jgi:hypothetical protein
MTQCPDSPQLCAIASMPGECPTHNPAEAPTPETFTLEVEASDGERSTATLADFLEANRESLSGAELATVALLPIGASITIAGNVPATVRRLA